MDASLSDSALPGVGSSEPEAVDRGQGRYDRSPLAPPTRTLMDVLADTVRAHADAPAIDDGDRRISYRDLWDEITTRARTLYRLGVRPGDRVGVRMSSGSADLYLAILAVLRAGAAYVPVDIDDPAERARTVFGEAAVAGVLSDDFEFTAHGTRSASGRDGSESAQPDMSPDGLVAGRPDPEDDAWIIFTSGSTGTPKGVAVRHRNAAAFVDAEARLFLQDDPLGPGDRVLAGLSVAFDASCEEMWLAWRNGACLVPAPRALVRTGMDLGPWLVEQQVSIISTVPTLAGLWQPEELAGVRMLIFGGEACPPELAARLATNDRQVWNTYGPTEATVVACAALMDGTGPVRIGFPLDGWDLAVVDGDGRRVGDGEVGELVIGGVGLARYLDPAKDAEKYAPAPALGWERAYRSGDLVRLESAGLVFMGRADDQVKLGGRRIELGEVDAALQDLPGVAAAAAAVRRTDGGSQLLVGYLAPHADASPDLAQARGQLRDRLPAALVPKLVVVDTIPTKVSGKVDRDALPWPVELSDAGGPSAPQISGLGETGEWLAQAWARVLGTSVTSLADDFFDAGGGSLAAAQLVSALRTRVPTITVADIYDTPGFGDLLNRVEEFDPPVTTTGRHVRPVPLGAQWLQTVLGLPLLGVVGLRWLTWLALLGNLAAAIGHARWIPHVSWWWILLGWLVLITPLGRMGLTVALARVLLRGLTPGRYPRGGSMHLRLWFTEAFASAAGVGHLAAAPWLTHYARALGARIGRNVDLHSLPPVTGMLTLKRGASIEPEVDLSGHWVDGDVVHVGRIRVDAGATVGSRSVLLGGTRVGQEAVVAPGSAVLSTVPPGELWAGSPAEFIGRARLDLPERRLPKSRVWVGVYAATAAGLAALPLVAALVGLAVMAWGMGEVDSIGQVARRVWVWVPLGAVVMFVVQAFITWACVRLLGWGLVEGHHPIRSRVGWQVWATERLMDDARGLLFPLYASMFTPVWLRALGAKIAPNVEASTVLMLPSMTSVGEGAFLADDTMIASYELSHGWLRIERAKVGKRAFLGNSGMTAPGRRVPKHGLVAVLSSAPPKAKKGTSWVGSPPQLLRRDTDAGDDSLTFAPPTRLRFARAGVEVLRVFSVIGTVAVAVGVLLGLEAILIRWGLAATVLAAAPVMAMAALVSCAVAVAAKWLLVGRIRTGEHPLWSSFIWRNELADTFVEMMAVPWFARGAYGAPVLNWWLRAMGAHIGRGVWCETYWLPEADLVHLEDGSCVNVGCVVQTHLFHDRVMSLDEVRLAPGATLGSHSVVLPAARLGEGTTAGPSSLVLRGDTLPDGTRWTGNPVAPWAD
ncbi:MAG: Pls/PosA family non-ribosomal peptide synthetase [Actinomycetales bacterium]